MTKKFSTEREKLEQMASKFVEETKKLIEKEKPELVLNTDQSGFQRELHRLRTLEVMGTKKVHGVAQSISATTHSYTICPVVSMDGELYSPMLIVIGESSGSFPKKRNFSGFFIYI